MFVPILRVAVPVPLHRYFDYLPPENWDNHMIMRLPKGIRVCVPFGARQVIGFLVAVVDTSPVPYHQLKRIIEIREDTSLLSPRLLQLLEWTSQYYHYPLGEVFSAALPSLLRKVKISKKISDRYDLPGDSFKVESVVREESQCPVLNAEQRIVVDAVGQLLNQFQVFLLEGVTSSGKTEVYLQLMTKVLLQGGQILFLLPEISLTPQTLSRLSERFTVPISLFHSGLSERERLYHWQQARIGKAGIVIGTRSAVFTALPFLGLIIVDEEHDGAFHQKDRLTYHARDVAIMRARMEQIPIVLGSATPTLETLWNANCYRYQRLTLSKRAGGSVPPQLRIIDVRSRPLISGLSEILLDKMQEHLANQGQVLLFLNRRGFSVLYLCHGCGWMAECRQCDSALRLHQRPAVLRCHYCGGHQKVPVLCPACHQPQLFDWGYGTQKLTQTLEEYFPDVQSIRIDTDSVRKKNSLPKLLANVQRGVPSILIGTQMLAKGHHFPNVTLAAVVNADVGLFRTDFRAVEQSAQLVIQVAGRAGRSEKAGEVLIQTHYPHHPWLKQLIDIGYSGFSQLALRERKEAGWPPFSYLALLRAEARSHRQAIQFLEELKEYITQQSSLVTLWGPVPALMARRSGYYRSQLLMQANERVPLRRLLSIVRLKLENLGHSRVRWLLEVDPLEVD